MSKKRHPSIALEKLLVLSVYNSCICTASEQPPQAGIKRQSQPSKIIPLLMVGLEGSGSIHSLLHISHWDQLPLVPQNGQMPLGTRGLHLPQLKESHSKRCWCLPSIEQNKHFPSSRIKVQFLTLAHQHCPVPGCWEGRYFTRTWTSTSNYSFEFGSWQTTLTEPPFNGHSIVCSE